MKFRAIIKKLGTFALIVCAMFAISITAFADDENEAVKEARNGVVQVNLVYVDADGNSNNLQGGTGFLINSEYVLTCYHVTHIDKNGDVYAKAVENWGSEFTDHIKDRVKIRIVLTSDVTIWAEEKNGSEIGDYDIIQLQETINGKTALVLGDSDVIDVSQDIFSLGFPAKVTGFKSGTMYNSSDVTITTGNVQKILEDDGVDYIQHSAGLSYGNSGGPLLDKEGQVIGINRTVIQDDLANNYFYAVSINQIKTTLDMLGIEYTSEAGAIEETTIDEETATDEETTIEPATLAPVTTAAPIEKGGLSNGLIVGIVAGIIVLVVIIIVIVVVATKGKGKGNVPPQTATPRSVPPMPAAPVPPHQTSPQYNAGEGSNETTVLNEGGGETTVLGGQPTATLLRMKNGEKVTINRPEFTIGKERRKVDYCISDNNSVSRCHTKIITRGGQHFVIDMNSTNFTYVNGVKIAPNQEKALASGDKIKISDEEFEFRTF